VFFQVKINRKDLRTGDMPLTVSSISSSSYPTAFALTLILAEGRALEALGCVLKLPAIKKMKLFPRLSTFTHSSAILFSLYLHNLALTEVQAIQMVLVRVRTVCP
jgi:hypothetical protein